MTIDASRIKEHMPVKDVNGKDVATVDAVEGDFIKLEGEGRHHWITMDLVDRVDESVHLNVEEAELKRLWVSEDPNRQDNRGLSWR